MPLQFSEQPPGDQKKVLEKFTEVYEASGHDIGTLLIYFLEHTKIGRENSLKTRNSTLEVLHRRTRDVEKQIDCVMSSIRELHASSSDREKLRIMSLIAPIFTRTELIRRGFVVSNDAFANARKHAIQKGPGSPVATGGRPRIYTPELVSTVVDFCNHPDNSVPITASRAGGQNSVAKRGIAYDSEVLNLQILPNQMSMAIIDYANNFLPPDATGAIQSAHGLAPPDHQPAQETTVTRVLKCPIATLYSRFLQMYPDIHITYQALRAMIPAHIAKRSRGAEEEECPVAVSRKKRGRPKASGHNSALRAHHHHQATYSALSNKTVESAGDAASRDSPTQLGARKKDPTRQAERRQKE